MFNDPIIVIIDGLPPYFTKPDVIKMVMQMGSVNLRVLSLRNSFMLPLRKTAHILILNSSIVESVMKYFNGFMIGNYRLTTSNRPFLRRTSRFMYQPDATADQKRYYNLGHQILNETKSYHPNFCNIDLKCHHRLSLHVLDACVEEMAKIEAKERRALSNHELTKAYRIQHPLNKDAERFVVMARPLCNLDNSQYFFSKTNEQSIDEQRLVGQNNILAATCRKQTFIKNHLKSYLEQAMKREIPDKNEEQCDITTAHEMVYKQVEKLQSELLFHLTEMMKQETMPGGHQLSTNYLKIYGEPALPEPENLETFLKKYCPKEVYHHHEMYNLAVVLITHQHDLTKLLKANGNIIDGCLLHISPANTELIEDIQKKDDEDNHPQQQKVMEPMECDDVIVITDDETCLEDIPKTEVKFETKEGQENSKLLQETNIGGISKAEGSGNSLNSNVEQGVAKCKEECVQDIKTETVKVVNTNLNTESIEKIENTKTEAGQTKLPNNQIMEGQDMKECSDFKAKEADLSNEVGSAETDEDYKIIDEVFEDFSFDVICDSDE